MKNEVRIIGGRHRSRKLYFPNVPGLRPTPGRVRETLFNWLRDDIVGARCLDLFAGSGALGFEAISRGAASVVQVDKSHKVCASLTENIQRFGLANVDVLQIDVRSFLDGCPDQFDVVFLDPPFFKDWGALCCAALESGHLLAQGAKIYLETEAQWQVTELPKNWMILRGKTTGNVAYHLFAKHGSGPS